MVCIAAGAFHPGAVDEPGGGGSTDSLENLACRSCLLPYSACPGKQATPQVAAIFHDVLCKLRHGITQAPVAPINLMSDGATSHRMRQECDKLQSC